MRDLGIIKAGLAAGLLVNLSQYGLNVIVRQASGEPIGWWMAHSFALGFAVASGYASMLGYGWDAGAKTAIKSAILTWIFFDWPVLWMFTDLSAVAVA